jgi:filamentous hemagglutinin family protein
MAKFWRKDTQAAIAWVSNDLSRFHGCGFLGSLMGWCLVSYPLAAQVTPDSSLGTETNTENNVTEITGGTSSNSNLFHSFQEFSVETGNTAYFNNGAEISNIIGRVTGSSVSNIDGLIRANGDANLILINPNGITLGSNARLDIGGSFLGSTANSVVFADGTVFNTNLNSQPLLTISAPIGLQLGQDSAGIEVSGAADLNTGLEISPGNTFALVGNGITFDGGVVTAESGRIDLGSVGAGQVSITEIAAGWQLGYEEVTQFGELQLLGRSALFNPNRVANSTGGIQVQGSNITLERSQITAQTLADAPGGNIVVNASESLALSGKAAVGENSSQISNNVRAGASGQGGAIDIATGKLDINPRSFIDNSIFGAGSAGDIKIAATQINLNGAGFLEFQQRYRIDALEGNLRPGSRITGIFAGTATTGTAGNITIETDALNLTDGAIIFTPVYTAGNGGNINVTAKDINLKASAIQNGGGVDSLATASLGNINLTSDRLKVSDGATVINLTFGDVSGGSVNVVADSIDLSNSPPESIVGTGLFTNTTLGSGEGGNLNVSANTITLKDAVIASNSGAILPDGTVIPSGGSGGDIKIEARESIDASGVVFNIDNPQLSVSAVAGIGTTTFSASDGGNLTIDTGKLLVRDGANFASSTFNGGDGGQLTINAADSVELIGITTDTGITLGGLFASSGSIRPELEVTGASGNISINTPNLTVRDSAIIDVQNDSVGDAGSINLVSDSVLLANEGALSAATQDGAGGNIQIDTKVLQLNRGLINASVLGQGTGGNIEINAQDSVQITGTSYEQLQSTIFDSNLFSPEFLASLSIDQINEGILAAAVDGGDAGIIEIQTANLELKQGGLIATATAGSGAAGSILLNTSESLVVDSSFISNNSLFSGAGGDIAIDTSRLEILQGGQITASTLGRGNGGSVTIDASESVTVAGRAANAESLASGAETLASNISVGAQPLPTITGNGGDLTINTPQLKIDDRATISIGSTGSGNAGSLEVNADSIMLDRQGGISADTQSGGGGNIILNADHLIWRGESFTTATSRGTGNGGNITLNSNNLLVLEDSRITANAFMGMGGNIQVDTQGLFICQTCQVTASSELGLDGLVDIETLEPTTLSSLEIPQQPTQPQQEVAVACPSEPRKNISQLTITGRGGLPNRPQELLNARSLIEFPPVAATKTPIKQATLPPPARGWYRQPNGEVMLTAQNMVGSPHNSPINTVNCHNYAN